MSWLRLSLLPEDVFTSVFLTYVKYDSCGSRWTVRPQVRSFTRWIQPQFTECWIFSSWYTGPFVKALINQFMSICDQLYLWQSEQSAHVMKLYFRAHWWSLKAWVWRADNFYFPNILNKPAFGVIVLKTIRGFKGKHRNHCVRWSLETKPRGFTFEGLSTFTEYKSGTFKLEYWFEV